MCTMPNNFLFLRWDLESRLYVIDADSWPLWCCGSTYFIITKSSNLFKLALAILCHIHQIIKNFFELVFEMKVCVHLIDQIWLAATPCYSCGKLLQYLIRLCFLTFRFAWVWKDQFLISNMLFVKIQNCS